MGGLYMMGKFFFGSGVDELNMNTMHEARRPALGTRGCTTALLHMRVVNRMHRWIPWT